MIRVTFNGLNPWILYKYYRKGGKSWQWWSILWFSHFIYQSGYGTHLHPPEYYFRTFSPNKGKNMNVTPNTNTVDTFDNGGQQPYYIDAEGNRVEIPFDVAGDGEAAQQETAFIAEDAADHAVTVH